MTRMLWTGTLLLISLAAGSPLALQAAPQNPPSMDMPALMKDLETMRRIIMREIRGEDSTAGALSFPRLSVGRVYYSGGGRASAYYIPGEGALFVIPSGVVLAGEPKKGEKASGEKEPSLWDEVQAEVDGRPLSKRDPGAAAGFDQDKVNALRDKVLHAVGRFAVKIGQLGDDAHITVVLTGEANGYSVTANGLTTQTGGDGHFVLRVRKGDAKEYSDNKIGLPELLQRSQTAQYSTGDGETVNSLAPARVLNTR